MERNLIKKMSLALKAFSTHKSMIKMTAEELEFLPKEVMVGLAFKEIPLVWDKLPEHIQDDPQIQIYLKCDAYNNNSL